MSTRDALVEAMHRPADSDAVGWLHSHGLAVTDEDTMSKAIHDIYCGVMADHFEPNDKDRDQARSMIAALQKHTAY